MSEDTIPIPGPRGIPVIGNLFDIDSEVPERGFEQLADIYGPVYRLVLGGHSLVLVSTHELVDEVCNEERFTKAVIGGLREIRNGVQDGLFTAHYPPEEDWAVAHRVLVPAFGPLMIRAMFDDMWDIATQLVMKWARQGPSVPIMVTDDFTRLTLDTIGLCSMGTRFNSFYREELHPFIQAMGTLLSVSGSRARRPPLVNSLPTSENKKYWNDIAYLRSLSQELVDARRNNPEDKKDLLNALVLGRDPKTGNGLSDDSIINNMLTFLIAGHETTSGSLSFLFYYFLKNPHTYKKAKEEVDSVLGRRRLTVEDLPKFIYIDAALKETMRLRSSAPLMACRPHPTRNTEDPVTLGNGKYALRKDEPIVVILKKLHRDPKVYGSDAEEFKPERMLDGKFEKLPKNAWKPFGNGIRGCIGRPFAWQEMLLVVAVLLQNFEFELDDPSYDLEILQALSIKPKNFRMKAKLRGGLDATQLAMFLGSGNDRSTENSTEVNSSEVTTNGVDSGTIPMHIFFGSNTGTCEAFSRRLANDAIKYGLTAEVRPLDSATRNVPKTHPVVFITASYEGQPPDNATTFFEWLSGLGDNSLEGVNYAVFGCGHHDWQSTYHRVPKAVDYIASERGGNRLCELGVADAANADMFTDFDSWTDAAFWPAISSLVGHPIKKAGLKFGLRVGINPGPRASTLGLQLQEGIVLENRLLTAPGVPEKRMLRFRLPPPVSYTCGDYLAVLPINPAGVTRRAIRRFNLPWDATLTVTSNGATSVPLNTPVSAFELFSTYFELSQPASKRDLHVLADAASTDPCAQKELRDLLSSPDRFAEEIVKKRISPLDILAFYPCIQLALEEFLAMLPPMRVRQYSISSSPLTSPSECTITFSVVKSPQTDNTPTHIGVASTYLSELQPGEQTQIAVRPCHPGFRPPLDLTMPVIMVCAGSGLAPFRGFIMDRAEKIRRNRVAAASSSDAEHGDPDNKPPGKAILYVGCRTKGKDDIHVAELDQWATEGAVEVRWAYSQPENDHDTPDFEHQLPHDLLPNSLRSHVAPADQNQPQPQRQHVQDLMMQHSKEISEMLDQGSRIYVCGGIGVANGARQAIKSIYLEKLRDCLGLAMKSGDDSGEGEADPDAMAEAYLENLKTSERYATDVFT